MSLTMHLWQATGLAVVAALLTVALRRGPARTRVGLWLFASIQFFVPLSALAALGGTAGGQFASGLPAPVLRLFELPFAVSAIAVAGMDRDGGLPAAWVAVIAIVWAAGVGAMAAWRWREWRAVSRLANAAQPLEHGCEADALRRMCASAGIGAVELRQTASMIEPAVVGIIRPRLLWPEGLSARLSREEIEAVLAHEVSHVAHRDNLGGLLHILVEAVFWFHPMVWWIGARMVAERERACDEEVIRMGIDRRHYAKGLVTVGRFCFRAPSPMAAGVGSSGLRGRIQHVLTHVPPPARGGGRLVAPVLAAVAAAVAMAAGAGSAAAAAQGGQDERVPAVTQPSVVTHVAPSYTSQAMRAGIEGTVLLEAVVGETGAVGEIRVVRSLDTEHGLDDQAIAALRRWQFEPGRRDGEPVAVSVTVVMDFVLRSSTR